MKITAIIGRAGSGKSRGLFEAAWDNIRHGEPKPIKFLVPEQATHHTERRLISPPDITGCLRTEVLSFRRLFGGLNRAEGPRIIDEVEKRLILAAILRTGDFDAEPFDSIKGRPGFIASLSRQIQMLKRADTEPEGFGVEPIEEPGGGFTGAKLVFLRRIFDVYGDTLARMDLRDAEDCIDELAAMAEGEDSLKGVTWFIDGFSGFTPQEKSALRGILAYAEEAWVALCLAPDIVWKGLDKSRELFTGNFRTFEWFREFAEAKGFDFEVKPVKPRGDFPRFSAPGLNALERSIFAKRKSRPDAAGAHFIPTVDERDSARKVAYEIKRLVCNGLRYRDIAVVLRGLGSYADYLAEAFDNARIPHFIDRRQPLRGHPLSRSVLGAWELVMKNFHRDALVDILRTGIAPMKLAEADDFENYLLAYGLSFDLIAKEWLETNPESGPAGKRAERREQLRKPATALLEPLAAFAERIGEIHRANAPLSGYSQATLQLLDDWGIDARMPELARELGVSPEDERQVYDAVVEILNKIQAVMGDEYLPPADYAAVLRAAMDVLSAGRIPPALDAVMVGEIHRSRIEEARAVFVCELREGVFPMPPAGAGLFDERELRGLSERFPDWATDYKLQQAEEEYLFYIACTRAREHLFLLHPRGDEHGGAPSPFIREAKNALGVGIGDEAITLQWPMSLNVAETAGRIAAAVNEKTAGDNELNAYGALASGGEVQDVLKYVFSSLGYTNRPGLEGRWIEHRADNLEKLDASRLRAFANCPFQYFAQYDIKLRLRPISEITVLELGSFIHKVLEHCFRQWFPPREDAEIGEPADMARQAVEYAQSFAAQFRYGVLLNNPRERLLLETRVYPLLREFVEAELSRLKTIAFKPVAFERRFGVEGHKGVMLPIPEHGEIELTGALDRIDVCTDGKTEGAVALDYKYSRAKPGLPKRMGIGLEVQIPVYLRALSELMGYRSIAGIFFYLQKGQAESPEKAAGGEFKRRGLFIKGLVEGDERLALGSYKNDGVDEDSFDAVLMDSFNRLGEYGRRLLGGDIDVMPYIYGTEKPCTWCDYRDLCRLDLAINSYRHPEVQP